MDLTLFADYSIIHNSNFTIFGFETTWDKIKLIVKSQITLVFAMSRGNPASQALVHFDVPKWSHKSKNTVNKINQSISHDPNSSNSRWPIFQTLAPSCEKKSHWPQLDTDLACHWWNDPFALLFNSCLMERLKNTYT